MKTTNTTPQEQWMEELREKVENTEAWKELAGAWWQRHGEFCVGDCGCDRDLDAHLTALLTLFSTQIEAARREERQDAQDAAKRLKDDLIAACGKDGRPPEIGVIVYLIDQIFFPSPHQP